MNTLDEMCRSSHTTMLLCLSTVLTIVTASRCANDHNNAHPPGYDFFDISHSYRSPQGDKVGCSTHHTYHPMLHSFLTVNTAIVLLSDLWIIMSPMLTTVINNPR